MFRTGLEKLCGKTGEVSFPESNSDNLNSAVGWSLFAVVMQNPAAPEKLPENLLSLHFLLSASFLLGILTFFCALGASGWIYSRKLGYTSSIVSITAGILTIYVISRFVVIQ
jgi:hypothetical protein